MKSRRTPIRPIYSKKPYKWVVASLCLAAITLGLAACALRQEFVPAFPAEFYERPQYLKDGTGGEAVRDSTDTISFTRWSGTVRLMELCDGEIAIILPDSTLPDSTIGFYRPGYIIPILPDSLDDEYWTDGLRIKFSGYPKYRINPLAGL